VIFFLYLVYLLILCQYLKFAVLDKYGRANNNDEIAGLRV
jgi:hypothetical protein